MLYCLVLCCCVASCRVGGDCDVAVVVVVVVVVVPSLRQLGTTISTAPSCRHPSLFRSSCVCQCDVNRCVTLPSSSSFFLLSVSLIWIFHHSVVQVKRHITEYYQYSIRPIGSNDIVSIPTTTRSIEIKLRPTTTTTTVLGY